MSNNQAAKKGPSLITIALVLGGLAFLFSRIMTSPEAPDTEASAAKAFEPVPDKAVVYVFRSTLAGGMHTFRTLRLYIDGAPLGDIGNGAFFRTVVSPGAHKMQVTNVRNEELGSLDITAETNQLCFIELSLSDPLSGKPSLKLAEGEEARKTIAQCKMLKGGSN